MYNYFFCSFMKTCIRCKKKKQLIDFNTYSGSIDNLSYWCKECGKVRAKSKKYKIAEKDLDALIANQKGFCYICGKEDRLCIDHNHSTGKVRKLLCNRCNMVLGNVEESEVLLLKMIMYLKEHKKD